MGSPLRRFSTAALPALLAIAAVMPIDRLAHAEDAWPSRPIRIVLPYSGGGSADALARAVGEQLSQRFGQSVLVDSRPGANSMLGADIVAKAAPDGYTLLYVGWPTISTNLVTYKKVAYKLADFQPITTFYRSPIGLTVKKDLPVGNLRELLDYGRKNGGIAFGTSGSGSSPHLLLERMKQATGVTFTHVPYKGEGPAVIDVMGGSLPMFAGGLTTPLQFVKNGSLKVVAVSSAERLPAFPDVETFKEAGFGGQTFTFWHGLAAPAGTPRSIIDKLHAAVVAAMDAPSVRAVLGPDQIVSTTTPEGFAELIRSDIDTWGPVIRASNLAE